MDCVIPYTKELTFDSKIAEITTISLEHELNVKPGELNGNFIVSGEYKAHELSVNKEKFKYDLPFFIELGENVDKDTIEFSIEDFNYNVIDDNILKVNIEFRVKGEEKVLKEEETDKIFNDVPDANVVDTQIELREENTKASDADEEEQKQEEIVNENEKESESEKENIDNDLTEERLDNITEKTILENIASTEDEYITYHIHIVKENETIESIANNYKTTANTLGEYNDIKDLKIGDKLIIPQDLDE